MSFAIIKKFHPFALLVSLGLFFLITLNLNSSIPIIEKLFFLVIAGLIFFTLMTFESWRIYH